MEDVTAPRPPTSRPRWSWIRKGRATLRGPASNTFTRPKNAIDNHSHARPATPARPSRRSRTALRDDISAVRGRAMRSSGARKAAGTKNDTGGLVTQPGERVGAGERLGGHDLWRGGGVGRIE